MRAESHIQTTIELLEEYSVQTMPFARFFPSYVRQRRYMGSKDRKAVFAYAMGIFRLFFSLKRSSYALGLDDNFRSLMLVYLKMALQKDNHDIKALFIGGYGPEELSGSERQALDFLSHNEGLDLSLEAPDFLLPSLFEAYGEGICEELSFMSQNILPPYFRVNPHKADIEDITEELKAQNLPVREEDMEARMHSPHPHLLQFFEPIDLKNHPFYKEGLIEVQDKAAQILCNLIKTKAGERLWDFCAGGGGKSLYVQSDNPSLEVILSDIYEVKLKNAMERFQRAGLKKPQQALLPNGLEKMSAFEGKIDHMILDVPCSSLGTWQRNPDLKLRISEDYLAKIVQNQRHILSQAAPFVKTGGRLYYFTCSLLAQENDEQISWFLKSHPQFKQVSIAQENEFLHNEAFFPHNSNKNSLTIWPKTHHCDGFFAAILEKV